MKENMEAYPHIGINFTIYFAFSLNALTRLCINKNNVKNKHSNPKTQPTQFGTV